MPAWNGWWHVNGDTYGTWLRGDSRGWRARHHREHVEGDHKNPPPEGKYEYQERLSRRLMKRPVVHLSKQAMRVACGEIAASLQRHDIEVIGVCVDYHHFHILARFPDGDTDGPWRKRRDGKTGLGVVQHFVGIAKKDSGRALSDGALVAPGGVWGVRARCLPVKDRSHQLNCYRYIIAHRARGAAVWTFREGRKS